MDDVNGGDWAVDARCQKDEVTRIRSQSQNMHQDVVPARTSRTVKGAVSV